MNAKPNRLLHEHSPYLQQHASNPVDWYPWGEEAFAKAKAEDKPIFLSIGYSTCHWCHVMAHESFEDPVVSTLLNDGFVNIKVDREERPDIDNLYMTVCHATIGRGGWPLTVLLTPDKKPFFAGTYIPKKSRQGLMGLYDFLPKVIDAWKKTRAELVETSEKLVAHVKRVEETAAETGELDAHATQTAQEQLTEQFDSDFGGFGSAPKFPSPHTLLFLLRRFAATGDAKAFDMVTRTLVGMRMGGVYDHLGYGFHRYSTDRYWFLPHFEKMLYDQALIAMTCTEAFAITKGELFRQTANEIFEYVERDMTSPNGAFYSAEDADSEGEEGKFYVFTRDEIESVLGKDEADLFAEAYGFEDGGNFAEEASGEKTGSNILHLPKPLAALAEERGEELESIRSRLTVARQALFAFREKRVHPHKDDKILTDWNGLMIAALAQAGRVFENSTLTDRAARAAQFFLNTMRNEDGTLLHRYREGQAGIDATLIDYAYLTWGLIELHQATLDHAWLDAALDLTRIILKDFLDTEVGGFFLTSHSAEELFARQKDIYDGALPSGNAVSCQNLLRLSRLTGNTEFDQTASEIMKAFAGTVIKQPMGFTHLLSAVLFAIGPSTEIHLQGTIGDEKFEALRRVVATTYAPFTTIAFEEASEPQAGLCRGGACQPPVHDAQTLTALMSSSQ
ncbi:thioredoxin domain-containing protein [Desulfovibrio inopinatus]|uniref:thioredoxin domain-containing protein n=1 Tax=Desulfovibrio inopinatus TaxID=102109 RepID=UPI000402A9AE|nr:thioredoxin domain-containing protein [Desulfovibrio inopinatus]